MTASAQRLDLSPVLAAQTMEAGWDTLSVDERRQLIGKLMRVRLLPAPRGIKTFDPATVAIEWRG